MSQELAKDSLIISKEGKPFANERLAKLAITGRRLNPTEHTIVEVDGGFAIKKITSAVEMPVEIKDEKGDVVALNQKKEEYVEKFYKVRFHDKSNPNDTNDVSLGVNGEILVAKRNEETIIPGRYAECARHATHDIFKQLPGERRKITGKVMTFPFDVICEVSQAEYLTLKSEGTKKTQEALDKASL